MKRLFFLFLFVVFWGLFLLAQDPPPPPPPGGGHGSGSNQTGGAAPLTGGIAMLLTMGAGYAVKKLSERHLTSR